MSVLDKYNSELVKRRYGIDSKRNFNRLNWGTVKVPEDVDIMEMIDRIRKLELIEDAEPNFVGEFPTTPNDGHFSKQWGLVNTSSNTGQEDSDIGADLAWDHTTGSSDVVIAVLDSGIPMQDDGDGVWDESDLSHDDLNDGSKFVLGTDHPGDGEGVKDNFGHGTHVTGIASAETDNNEGVAGVCWQCKVLAIQVGNANDVRKTWVSDGILEAVDYKTNNAVEVVINASIGYETGSSELENALTDAENNDVSVVVAGGNASSEQGESDGTDCDVHYPAAYSSSYSNVIAVASTNHNDNWSNSSCTGSELNVAAPGGHGGTADQDDIFSTTPGYGVALDLSPNYDYMPGTSMAAPMVAGTVGLMLSLEPFLSPSEVRSILENEANDVNGGGFDNELGHGRTNAWQAVTEAAEPAAPTNLTITNADQTGQHPNLDWDDNSEPDIDHYNVERCTSYYTSCNWSKIAETTTSDYTDTWVSTQDKENADHEYTYQVLAVDTDSYSSFPSKLVSVWGIEPHSSEPQYAEAPAVPDTFALRAPTPNPAADRARLRVHVPEARTVIVVVHDLMGREVARLADRRMRPGIHSLTVQARQWPSEVYLVRMRAGQFSATERLTVVR